MFEPLSVEDQMELIKRAIGNELVINNIVNTEVYNEEDKYQYIRILKCSDLERAFAIYANMDTAAREEFIGLIREE